ncbi:MAG TPA: Dyp-type peroxidase [Burkholderiaceae bacterium]|nr:Dyp-type peroxidase [Burkholderiaceae bacterium]
MPAPSASPFDASPESQPIVGSAGPLAMFIVLGLAAGDDASATVRGWCGQVGALARSMRFRFPASDVRCVVGFGADAWDRLFGLPRPAQLQPFEAIRAGDRHAPSTPGDILIHLRADRADLVFDLAARLVAALGAAVFPIDEVHGFNSFDARSILGFVDGTENPQGDAADAAAFIGAEDAAFAGGSYVLVQKYLHRMDAWKALSIAEQEQVFGRTKIDDVEMDDAVKPSNSHIALNVITDDAGEELKIVRANLPFGQPSRGEYGTYFIGYARDPAITLRMLSNMFVGDPPGNYDRLLDFSDAVTGTLFFVPSADLLEALAERAADADGHEAQAPGATASAAAAPAPRRADGSLAIGALESDPAALLPPSARA